MILLNKLIQSRFWKFECRMIRERLGSELGQFEVRSDVMCIMAFEKFCSQRPIFDLIRSKKL